MTKSKKIFVTILTVVMLMQCINFSANATVQDRTIIYVAQNGNDENVGTVDKPFATLEKARDTIREKKKNGTLGEKGAVVYVREGIYSRNTSFVLDEQDSGSMESPIVYRAFPGELVSFIGGASVPANMFDSVKDAEILDRIIEKEAKDKVLQVDLSKLGFHEIPEQRLIGTYSYSAREVMEYYGVKPVQQASEVFFEDKVLTLARYPKEGFMTSSEVIKPGAIPRDWESDRIGSDIYVEPEDRDPSDNFIISVDDNRVVNWSNANHALMFGYWRYDWADQTVPLGSVDVENKLITSGMPSYYSVLPGRRFYIYNLLEEVSIPGEYYIDIDTSIMYLYPPEGFGKNSRITISVLADPIFFLNNTSNISIKGFEFSVTRGNAVNITGGNDNEILDCVFSYTGDRAVIIEGGNNNGIRSCYLFDVNGGIGVSGGDRVTLLEGNNYAENNHLERFSRLRKTYNAAINVSGCGNRISHNLIHNGEHTAIVFGGNNHTIEYNEIFDVCKTADDMGAIYRGRDWTMRGNRIIFNYIHDIVSDAQMSHGIHGVYLDDCFSSAYIAGNVFENITAGSGVFIGGGRDNVVYNNITINSRRPLYIDNRGYGGFMQGNKSLYDSLESVPYKSDVWKESYPELYKILDDDPGLPMGNVYKNNLSVNSGKEAITEISRRYLTEKNNYDVQSDPGFVDMKNRIYLLDKNSEVFTAIDGFSNVPFTRMGSYSQRALERIKNATVLLVGSPTAYIKGKTGYIDNQNDDIVPVIVEGTAFVPLRFVSESLGANVEWDESDGIIIQLDDIFLRIKPSSSVIQKNGQDIEISESIFLLDNRAYIPLRTVAELLNKYVFWDNIGLIAISDTDTLFNPENDRNLIMYIYDRLNRF